MESRVGRMEFSPFPTIKTEMREATDISQRVGRRGTERLSQDFGHLSWVALTWPDICGSTLDIYILDHALQI